LITAQEVTGLNPVEVTNVYKAFKQLRAFFISSFCPQFARFPRIKHILSLIFSFKIRRIFIQTPATYKTSYINDFIFIYIINQFNKKLPNK